MGACQPVGLATENFEQLLIQCREDLSTMRAEPAGVIANCGLKNSQGFLPLTGAPVLDSIEGLDKIDEFCTKVKRAWKED